MITSSEDTAIDFLGTRVLLLCRGYSPTNFHNNTKYFSIIGLVGRENGNFFAVSFCDLPNDSAKSCIYLPEALVIQVAYLEKFFTSFIYK